MLLGWVLFNASLAFILYYFGSRRSRLPPGPFAWPIVGNILDMGNTPHLAFTKYAKIYGPIMSFRLGLDNAVVLQGAKLIREAFNEPGFSGRPIRDCAKFLAGSEEGILHSEGQIWAEQRRFTLRHLRDFGFGKRNMEGLIMEEVTELIEWIKQQNGCPVELHRRFSLAAVNSIWTITTGERFDHDDPKLLQVMDQLEEAAKHILGGQGKGLLVLFYPKIAKMFPNWSGWNTLVQIIGVRDRMFGKTIDEHGTTLPEGHARDFLDVYLQEVRKTTDPNSSFHSDTAVKALPAVMADLFLAGTDTTSATLSWAMLYLLYYPHTQVKLQSEIDVVVGKTRLPCIEDRQSMPYTEAFIMELMRMSSILPIGVNHATVQDVEFHGYLIPKRTVIFPNLYATHHDPDVWGDPENFRPERFLGQDGKTVLKNENLIPFSIGRRTCLGETLARDQTFLFITSLAQRFKIVPEPGVKPSLEGELVVTLQPKKYCMVMKERV